jgi:hypothetical protein
MREDHTRVAATLGVWKRAAQRRPREVAANVSLAETATREGARGIRSGISSSYELMRARASLVLSWRVGKVHTR